MNHLPREPMMKASTLRGARVASSLLVMGLAAGACAEFLDQRVVSEGNVLDLSLVPTPRFELIRAADTLIFDKADVDCATLMAGGPGTVAGEAWSGRLADEPVRRASVNAVAQAHRRKCELVVTDADGGTRLSDEFRFVLGRVCAQEGASGSCEADARGTKTVLVTVSYVDACDEEMQDELTRPGQVLAAGCEEIEVVSGKATTLDVVLFPWRDPQ